VYNYLTKKQQTYFTNELPLSQNPQPIPPYPTPPPKELLH
jgi:hypothetical protein